MERFHTYVARGKDSYDLGDHKDTLLLWRQAIDCLGTDKENTNLPTEILLKKAELLTRMVAVSLGIGNLRAAFEYLSETEVDLRSNLENNQNLKGEILARLARTFAHKGSILIEVQEYSHADIEFRNALEVFHNAIEEATKESRIWLASPATILELKAAQISCRFTHGVCLMNLNRVDEAIQIWTEVKETDIPFEATESTSTETPDELLKLDISSKTISDNAINIIQSAISQSKEMIRQAIEYKERSERELLEQSNEENRKREEAEREPQSEEQGEYSQEEEGQYHSDEGEPQSEEETEYDAEEDGRRDEEVMEVEESVEG